MIIGKQGSTVQQMQRDTGARISIKTSTLNGEITKTVIIRGTLRQISRAKSEIYSLLSSEAASSSPEAKRKK